MERYIVGITGASGSAYALALIDALLARGARVHAVLTGMGEQVLRYEMTGTSGPDHDRVFSFRVLLNGQVAGTGEGRSKKEAEQAAARCALEHMAL